MRDQVVKAVGAADLHHLAIDHGIGSRARPGVVGVHHLQRVGAAVTERDHIARRRFGGTLAGTITLTAGLGGMGGAQPLAVTMNDGVAICVDCDVTRIDRRIDHEYLDVKAEDIDDALRLAVQARDAKRPLSIGLLGAAVPLLLFYRPLMREAWQGTPSL